MHKEIQRAKRLCFPLELLTLLPSKGSPVGFRLLALTCRENMSQAGEIRKGVHCLFREGMPGCYLPPKGTFACSEMVETSIFVVLLIPGRAAMAAGVGHPHAWSRTARFCN